MNQAYLWLNDRPKLAQLAPLLDGMPINVDDVKMQNGSNGVTLSGSITGRAATGPGGAALPATALTLVFEFLDGSGAVVSTADVSVPALMPGALQSLSVEGTGVGIVSWRYHKR